MYQNLEPYIQKLENLNAWIHPTCDDLEKRCGMLIKECRRVGDNFYYDGTLAARITYSDLEINDYNFERVLIFEKKPDNNIPEPLKRHIGAHNGFTIFNGHWYALKPTEDHLRWIPVRSLLTNFRPFGILDPYANCFEVDYEKMATTQPHSILTYE